jgi:alpha-beta hydrolase superfamily lysophospholipase
MVFHGMGLNAFLVDFYGSGGSGGNETSIGFYEALDVAKAFDYARDLPGSGPVVIYGASMGAAAVLKGVADEKLQPQALILECPFDSLIGTVRHRFTTMGIPSFPLADLLVFWGGMREGFNGFRYRPVESASHIDRPTLLMNGDNDPWVRPEEARAIFDDLKGPKTLRFFAGVGHDSCLRRRPDEGKSAVSEFLDQSLGAPVLR